MNRDSNTYQIIIFLVHLIVQVVLLVFLKAGINTDEISPLEGLILWVTGGIGFVFLIRLLVAIDARELPGIESFWGGIDGGIGGWQLSKAASYLLIFLLLLFLFLYNTGDAITRNSDAKIEEIEEKSKEDLQKVLKMIQDETKLDSVAKKPIVKYLKDLLKKENEESEMPDKGNKVGEESELTDQEKKKTEGDENKGGGDTENPTG